MTTMTASSAAEAVANGAQRLDEHVSGWYSALSLASLDISDPDLCVCGQLGDAVWELMGNTDPSPLAENCGIVQPGGSNPPWTYAELTVEWRKAIIARRDADKLDRANARTRKENALV